MKTVYQIKQAFGDKLSGLRLFPGHSIVHHVEQNVVEFHDADGQPLTNELHGHPATDPPHFKDYFEGLVAAGTLAVDAPAKSKADTKDTGNPPKVDPPKTDPSKQDAPPPPPADTSKKTGK